MSTLQGTTIKNSGYLDKVYFNTSLSTEEVIAILEKLTYTSGSYAVCYGTNGVRVNIAKHDSYYSIACTKDRFYDMAFNTDPQYVNEIAGIVSTGWKTSFDNEGFGNPFEFNAELSSTDSNGNTVGSQNELLKNLISSTPFEAITLDEFLTGIAGAIRYVKDTEEKINALTFEDEIRKFKGGSGSGEDKVKLLFDTKKSCYYEFFNLYSLTYEQLVEIFTNPNITSSVNTMNNMFYQCSSLTSIPQLDTSSVTDMQNMFYNCNALTTIPPLDTSNVTNMQNMFYNCSSLTSIPQLDTNNVTNMNQMFVGCSKLTIIPQFNTSKVTSMTNMFYDCSSLESILMYGMSVNFNISPSTKFTRDSLVTILNNLATVTSTKKLTMGSTNLAKLTEEDKVIATNKGWTLA